MAEKTTQTTPVPSEAEAPAAMTAPAPAGRRTVSMPVLPFAIVGSLIVAAIFFGGGVAVGFAISHHPTRVGMIQPFDDHRTGPFGGPNGFGQNGGQNRGPHGGQDQGQNGGPDQGPNGGPDQGQNGRPTPAPTNG
ncbi:MAG: hypothetical protein ABIO06_11870 [Pseudolysinimonas sp.]